MENHIFWRQGIFFVIDKQIRAITLDRQACEEKLVRSAEGGFEQAEVNSCGLNNGPLAGEGRYDERIDCNFYSRVKGWYISI